MRIGNFEDFESRIGNDGELMALAVVTLLDLSLCLVSCVLLACWLVRVGVLPVGVIIEEVRRRRNHHSHSFFSTGRAKCNLNGKFFHFCVF